MKRKLSAILSFLMTLGTVSTLLFAMPEQAKAVEVDGVEFFLVTNGKRYYDDVVFNIGVGPEHYFCDNGIGFKNNTDREVKIHWWYHGIRVTENQDIYPSSMFDKGPMEKILQPGEEWLEGNTFPTYYSTALKELVRYSFSVDGGESRDLYSLQDVSFAGEFDKRFWLPHAMALASAPAGTRYALDSPADYYIPAYLPNQSGGFDESRYVDCAYIPAVMLDVLRGRDVTMVVRMGKNKVEINGLNMDVLEKGRTYTNDELCSILPVLQNKNEFGGVTYGTAASTGISAEGWEESTDGTWCYIKPDGSKATGWQKIRGKDYYFDANGVMASGYCTVDNVWHEFKASGEWVAKRSNSGWKKFAKGWSFKAGGKWVYNSWKKISDEWYLFDKSGYMKTGWHQTGRNWYLLDKSGAMVKGWKKKGGKYYFMDETTGIMRTGWITDGGASYYLNASGAMATNKWVKSGGKWYRLGANGAMVTSDTVIDKALHAFDASGVWLGVK